MLADVTIDGRTEAQFRLAIEAMVREGGADEAARILKAELAWLCGDGQSLPAHFRSIAASDLNVDGWDRLVERIGELDSPGDPITAIGIDICGMQAGLGAAPVLAFETTYYTDQAWGFSHADRDGISAGYQGNTIAWQGAFEDIDDALRVEGLDDLNAVIAALEHHCLSGASTPDERRAYVVGACYLAVLIHQAMRDKALTEGLPRAMAVLVGSNESYPWFEAPAVTAREGHVAAAAPRAAFGREPAPLRRPLDLSAQLAAMPRPVFDAEHAPFTAPAAAPSPAAPFAPPPPLANPFPPAAPFTAYSDSDESEDVEPEAPAPLFPAASYVGDTDWDVEQPEAETSGASLHELETPEFEHSEFEPSVEAVPAQEQDYAPLDMVRFPAQTAPIENGVEDEEALHLPPPGIHVTGTQLRRRFVDRETIAIEEERRPGLLERLFRRR
ncbi:hypothetical protein EDF56_101304 [Novosphingobium sp. PhB165]|uniref:hypothetical protein n=1 Tax=Novosphingobium sp. PhB165 TaxID=2485105 RepID=UPI00104A8B6F|nr:hypothetical protein [Novosphingobium sp. PhB165]TCM21636.1 hypothetical protein EDF56_101304 [Novosphingobium sp. PhB165]